MANPNVKNQGGPVIGNVQLVPIIWGNTWPYNSGSTLPAQLLAFLQYYVGPSSPNMAMLKEYSIGGTQIGPGSVLSNKMITAPGNPPASLSDSQIQSALQSWIGNQNGQTPSFPQPNANTVYVIFLPQAVTVNFQGQVSCSAFGGYHYFNGNVIYVLLPCCSPPGTVLASVLSQLTLVCSHELSEVITDPRGNGWLDTNTNPRDEIGDICQGTGYPQLNSPPGTDRGGPGQNFLVQAIWSQSQNNCVFGPPVSLLGMTLPSVVYGGQQVAGTLSLTDPVPTLPPSGITVALSTNNPAVKFNSPVSITPGNQAVSISAITTGVQQAMVVTIKATLGSQTIEQLLTLLPPGIETFEYTPGSAPGYQYPPNASAGALTLNIAAPPGGLTVSVASSEPLLVVPVPDELPIAAGALSPTVKFYLQVNPVGVNTPVILTASVSGSAVPFTFQVQAGGPPNIVVKSLKINPPTLIGAGTTFGEFTLAAPVGPGGGSIAVSSSDPTVATVHSPVVLAAGATGGSFPIQTRALQQPTTRKYCTIVAVENGHPAYALLTITS